MTEDLWGTTFYVAGPMRNQPKLNFPLFFYVEGKLLLRGAVVFNPARKDVEAGLDWEQQNGTIEALKGVNFDMREAIAWDVGKIIEECDSLVLLPGWQQSTGSITEYALARFLDLTIYEWVDNDIHPMNRKVYLNV